AKVTFGAFKPEAPSKPKRPTSSSQHKEWDVVTVSADGTVTSSRVIEGKPRKPKSPMLPHSRFQWPHPDAAFAAYSPDGTWWVPTGGEGTARLWNAAAQKPTYKELKHEFWVYGAAFSPDGRLVATVSRDRTARVWELPTGRPAVSALPHRGAVFAAGF